jgi:hypothetical protein
MKLDILQTDEMKTKHQLVNLSFLLLFVDHKILAAVRINKSNVAEPCIKKKVYEIKINNDKKFNKTCGYD